MSESATEPCQDCEGTGRQWSSYLQRPKGWGPEPTVILRVPCDCFFCDGEGRLPRELTEREARDELVALLPPAIASAA